MLMADQISFPRQLIIVGGKKYRRIIGWTIIRLQRAIMSQKKAQEYRNNDESN
jgi:hypothetical protein